MPPSQTSPCHFLVRCPVSATPDIPAAELVFPVTPGKNEWKGSILQAGCQNPAPHPSPALPSLAGKLLLILQNLCFSVTSVPLATPSPLQSILSGSPWPLSHWVAVAFLLGLPLPVGEQTEGTGSDQPRFSAWPRTAQRRHLGKAGDLLCARAAGGSELRGRRKSRGAVHLPPSPGSPGQDRL